MAAIDCSSSTGPQPNSYGPPMAQDPRPTAVISGPRDPSLLFGIIPPLDIAWGARSTHSVARAGDRTRRSRPRRGAAQSVALADQRVGSDVRGLQQYPPHEG